jgi:hypothetical protein
MDVAWKAPLLTSVRLGQIVNYFHAGGRASAWKFRVINRAPLLNVR